jgi:lipid-binding SYLF domain-containing protein
MKKSVVWCVVLCLFSLSAAADGNRGKIVGRADDAGAILKEIMDAPDSGIPQEILGSAECVAVVPSMLKGAFGFGGVYGRGLASCRTATGWSAPAFFKVEGGSFGLQIGGQAVDLVMVIMNQHGMQALLSSKFKLGADVSVAAGPLGREAEGMTDWKMKAQVLTYSRARGLFAGVALNGAVIKQDESSTRTFYGREINYKDLLRGNTPAPQDAGKFLAAIGKATGGKGAAAAK